MDLQVLDDHVPPKHLDGATFARPSHANDNLPLSLFDTFWWSLQTPKYRAAATPEMFAKFRAD